MDNVRYNISPCSSDEASAFIAKIDKSMYRQRAAVKADERSHYDRYSFLRDDSKVAVVYDTSASVISITAPERFSDELLAVFAPNDSKSVKRSTVPAQKSSGAADNNVSIPIEGSSSSTRARLFVNPKEIILRPDTHPTTVIATSKGLEISTDEIFPPQRAKKRTNIDAVQNNNRRVYGGEYGVSDAVPNNNRRVYGGDYSSGDVVPNNNRRGGAEQNGDGNAPGVYGVHISTGHVKAPSVDAYFEEQRAAQQAVNRPVGRPRKAVISFGDEDDDMRKPSGGTLRSGTGLYADLAQQQRHYEPDDTTDTVQYDQPQKRKRGRPRKDRATADMIVPQIAKKPEVKSGDAQRVQRFYESDDVASIPYDQPQKRKRGRPRKDRATADMIVPQIAKKPIQQKTVPEYKNGYSVKNYSQEKLNAMLKRLKTAGYTVNADGTEFPGTSHEAKLFNIVDSDGAKVYLRYATKKMTVQLQGKRSELFGEVQSQIGVDIDYSSALEGYIESDAEGAAKRKVSDVDNRLKKRLPSAYEFLSEQSRIDFSYGLHDFSQSKLTLSDYSVLLVPPFRGLERFVFDLQRAEGIKVKMIGQAFDKDNAGNYVLKNGYRQRINSVVYCEVMVALYTEYFSRRNFFAHSDNSEEGKSRAILDRDVAKGIFDNLLNVVEYNAKKLKEIGFSMSPDDYNNEIK